MTEKVYFPGTDSIPRHFTVGKDESLSLSFLVLPGKSVSVPLEVDLAGESASLSLRGLYICNSDQKVDFDIRVVHSSGRSFSSQLFNCIAYDSAKVSFHGLVLVPQDSQKIKAFQENHNILLSESATVETCPQLEIYADDVECSHGATTGFLSAEEQFYMRSRGIPEHEARVLQMISFLSPVLEGISDPVLRRKLSRRIEKIVRSL